MSNGSCGRPHRVRRAAGVTDRTVLFGGKDATGWYFSDTWQYAPTTPASYALFGAGCRGSAGVPALMNFAQRPWMGETFAVPLANLPANQPILMLLGSSKTTWFGFPLPLDLSSFGMSGCSLYVSGHSIQQVPNLGGATSWNLPIPNRQDLLGASFFHQALVVDPAANPAGATTSNAGEGKIGSK